MAPGAAAPRRSSDPARQVEISESLSQSFLVVLETLSPEQRAVFLLHDVFDYPYERIAEILDKNGPAVRQAAVRARRHVAERKPRFEATTEQHERLADRFFAAIGDGDLSAFESLLAGDVELARGRRREGAGARPLPRAAARGSRGPWSPGPRCSAGPGRDRTVPGQRQSGRQAARRVGARVQHRVELEFAAGEIRSVNSVVNPEKLDHVGVVTVGNLGDLIPGHRTKD